MRRHTAALLALMLTVGLSVVASLGAAATSSAGRESFRGVLIASGRGGDRTIVSTLAVATGVFTGVGRIVEIGPRPGDPANLDRDDLVFPSGRMHLLSRNKFVSMSSDPKTCALRVRARSTSRVRGGTGRFRHASGALKGTLRGRGVAPRNPDGACAQDQALLLEVDSFSERGTLAL